MYIDLSRVWLLFFVYLLAQFWGEVAAARLQNAQDARMYARPQPEHREQVEHEREDDDDPDDDLEGRTEWDEILDEIEDEPEDDEDDDERDER